MKHLNLIHVITYNEAYGSRPGVLNLGDASPSGDSGGWQEGRQFLKNGHICVKNLN
jgi:hypothetical protein